MSGVAADIMRILRPGDRIYLPGSTGEICALSAALARQDAPFLHVTATFVPGINPVLAGKLPGEGSFTGPFASGPRGGQAAGAFRHMALSYGAFRRYLEQVSFDAIVVQVAPPDATGRASLGVAVEFTPTAIRRSRRLIAVVNPHVPPMPGAESIDLRDADLVVETDEPLREYDVGVPSGLSDAIARNVADFIGDGAAIQIGLGKVPDALLRILFDRKRLRLQSGMLSDGTRLLAEAGALDPGFRHTSCVHIGSRSYYEWLRGRAEFSVLGCERTHSPALLGSVDGLIAVNSALSVDVLGQANLEFVDGRAISGVGGAADFARAASLSPSGISIVALPATSKDGSASRITARLDGVVSLPRHDIDVVVTEFGAADLRGLSVMERGKRIIAIADPRHREGLESAWREIAGKF